MFGDLIFREASGTDKSRAIELFEATYQEEVGFVPRDSLDNDAHHLVALTAQNDVVATLRLLGPQSRPFSVERLVPLHSILSPERRAGLLDHFAIRPDFRRISKNLFLQFAMLKLAYEYAKRSDLTDLIICALPALQKFYSSAHFVHTGLEFTYPGFGRQLAVMQMNLQTLPDQPRTSTISYSLLAPAPKTFDLPPK